MRFSQTWNAWKFAMFKNFVNSQRLKSIILSPNRCETQITKNFQTSKYIYIFYRSVTSTFVVQLFLFLFSSHSSLQNICFNDSGYVIKPQQPSWSSAFYRQQCRCARLDQI